MEEFHVSLCVGSAVAQTSEHRTGGSVSALLHSALTPTHPGSAYDGPVASHNSAHPWSGNGVSCPIQGCHPVLYKPPTELPIWSLHWDHQQVVPREAGLFWQQHHHRRCSHLPSPQLIPFATRFKILFSEMSLMLMKSFETPECNILQ